MNPDRGADPVLSLNSGQTFIVVGAVLGALGALQLWAFLAPHQNRITRFLARLYEQLTPRRIVAPRVWLLLVAIGWLISGFLLMHHGAEVNAELAGPDRRGIL